MSTATRTFTFLGTGTSVGVPMLGCDCAVCTSTDPRNQRYRCAVLIGTPEGNLLIDTPPEIRLQLLRARVGVVHSVLYTHFHADHLFGLDDLRPIPFRLGKSVPIYCAPDVERKIRQIFSYAFEGNSPSMAQGYLPKMTFHTIDDDPFAVLGQHVTPIPLIHGHFAVLGFRIGNVAYCTDVNKIPKESWSRLEGLDVLVLDALRHRPHITHFSVDEALEVVDRIRPKKTYFTHMCHELDHEITNRQLPPGVELAYDGLSFEF